MYKSFIRPILFLFSPETVHHLVVSLIKCISWLPGGSVLFQKLFCLRNPKLQKEVFGLKFPNPVGLAAGFDKNATFYDEFKSFGFGFIEIGTVTPKPQPGNPKPRSFRLPEDNALINRMGFNNLGVAEVVKNLQKRKPGGIIGGNIGKNTLTPNSEAVNDYEYCFQQLYDYVDYFVVNVSCPNISGLHELQDQDMLLLILNRLVFLRARSDIYRPILLKISPDLNQKQLDETITIVSKTGIDGLVATNTTILRTDLMTNKQKIQSIGSGGLSGMPISKRSTEMIRYIKEKSGNAFPVIGVGGIMSVQDAREKLEAGADLLQIYTGFIYEGPFFVKSILKMLGK